MEKVTIVHHLCKLALLNYESLIEVANKAGRGLITQFHLQPFNKLFFLFFILICF